MTLKEKHYIYTKKYNHNIKFCTWYKRTIAGMSDDEIFNTPITMKNHTARPNSIKQRWLKWKEETGETKCYEWFKRKINKWESLDEYTITITEQWERDWKPCCYSTYWQTHSPIIMNRITGEEVKYESTAEEDKEEVKKLDLTDVNLWGDDYYLTLT